MRAAINWGGPPIWSASINSEYRVTLGNLQGYGRVLFAYTGDQNSGEVPLDAYNTLDAYLGVRSERWHVEVFARNALDEEALITATPATAVVRRQPTGYANQFPIPGRRIGVTASFRW